ncbi:hypothetical protein EDC04DRAFT_2609064 [Pisolithus marmoratus]|nr:hypothetical protein EDC04DRAFT_2609064 [Pisolithus marmoratus]
MTSGFDSDLLSTPALNHFWGKYYGSESGTQTMLLEIMVINITLVTQSDPRTEKFGITNDQTILCQWHDASLISMLQHRWMQHKKNITPKIMWSQLCHQFTMGFETILEQGVKEGWYNIDNTLEWLVFWWLFVPWLQQELDAYWDHINNTAKCHDHNKVLPHGIPNLIYNDLGDYKALDFKVKVDPAAVEHVQALYRSAMSIWVVHP